MSPSAPHHPPTDAVPAPALPATLPDWLAHAERLHAQAIDMGLDRVHTVAERLRRAGHIRSDCPVITVAGTNGKGSTCAMLESIYTQAGYRTGVYTSPHLVHFEERCRLRTESIAAAELLPAFAAVEAARVGEQAPVSLTYFEFTTLAIAVAMSRAALDVWILEVGMGGRLDAVNVFDADCAVITSIDLDHMEFLGPDREAIGYEKAGIMRTGRPVVVSDPAPPASLAQRALEIGADLRQSGKDFRFQGDAQQWSWSGRQRRHAGLAFPALRGANQLVNAAGVLAAVEALHERLPVTAQAVRNGLALVSLPGRFQTVPGQPALVLDVAHNPHAAAALAANLDAMGYYPATHAVFGAMADKDLRGVFGHLDALVDRWYFTDLPTPRAAAAIDLAAIWHSTTTRRDAGCSRHATPAQALSAALAAADPADRIVVFGSFVTVGGVLDGGVPRLAGKHLSAQGTAAGLPRSP